MDDGSITSFRLRATRAAPPHQARSGDRRRTYGAALAQFEELMSAATAATPASRPLPLFYALSQAGRAITAAHGNERWRLRGHGLSCPRLEGEILAVVVRRNRAKETADTAAIDSFSGVGAASNAELFDGQVTLGELWTSLPNLGGLLPGDISGSSPRPLLLVPDDRNPSMLVPREYVLATLVGYKAAPETLPDHLRTHFPSAASIQLQQPQHIPHLLQHTAHGPGIAVAIEVDDTNNAGHLAALDRVAPGGHGFEARWLRPAVGGASMTPLMTWWALLFALSMLARYEPAGWTAALALDSSPVAAPLTQCLTIAIEHIPQLVLDAILSAGTESPEGDSNP